MLHAVVPSDLSRHQEMASKDLKALREEHHQEAKNANRSDLVCRHGRFLNVGHATHRCGVESECGRDRHVQMRAL